VRQKSFIALAVFLFLMLAGAIGVYAYDASRDDLIADGVSAGGVRVGGMRAAEARVAIEDQLAVPLRKALVVRYEGRRFKLTAARAKLRVNTERMVQEALDKSREGNIVSRTVRELTGADPDESQLPARVSYSRRAVDDLVKRVEGKLNQPAKDASVTFSGSSLGTVEGQVGVAVKTGKLRNAIRSELVLPAADRVVEVSTKEVQPEVTREELASKYPQVLTVDRPNFRLHLWRDLKLVKSYTVAIGAVGYDTPSGLYNIQNKAVNPAWTMPNSDWVAAADRGKVVPGGVPENPLKARWLGIYNGAGIHGTDVVSSLGSAASHGCIRMAIPDVVELYDDVPVGTPVYIS
jgi:lipoprotein-anchoring transpeptidase ErfK/SrfK